MKLILASGSKRRRELLEMCGYDFEVIVSDADEAVDETEPDKLVCALALKKAGTVYDGLRLKRPGEEAAVLGADTVVSIDGRCIGKPGNADEAVRILETLSGKTHKVYTGAAVVSKRGTNVIFDATEVTFKALEPAEIYAYVATGDSLDKAGAYGIQGAFGMFVERINGNYFNVVGMPLPRVYGMLKRIGILPHGFEGVLK